MAKSTASSKSKTINKAELKEQFVNIIHNDYQTTPEEA